MESYNKKNVPLARVLRKHATREEKKLWYEYLRKLPVRVQRQKPIGDYIVDFYCHSARLVIELDGSQHYEPEGLARDRIRTYELEQQGLLVVRIPNNEVKFNLQGVCEYIEKIIAERIKPCGI